MAVRDITALAIKLAGFVLLVLVASKLPEYFKSYLGARSGTAFVPIWTYIVPLLIPALLSIILITIPYKISDVVIIDKKMEPGEIDLSGFESIGIRLLGLLLLYLAISDLVFHISNYFMLRPIDQQFSVSAYNYPYLIATVAELLFAFWLLAGTRSVLAFLRKVRKA